MGIKNLSVAFLVASPLYSLTSAAGSAVQGTGSTTRGWSCCKNSCSWSGKAPVNNPVISCDNVDNFLLNPARRDGCESGGGSFACSDLSPWAVSNDLAYGYAGVNLAASNETAWCCACYQLTFTSGPVSGKKMIVQVTNTGSDLGNDQFDLVIPGGGQGNAQGCTKQFGRDDVWGSTYGGVTHRDECSNLPDPHKPGCYWRFDWFRNADNPSVQWEKVTCPEELSLNSNCRRNDDPVGGNTPTPTTSKALPIASGTVQQGGQCGGRRYSGPTVCVSGTVCTFVSEDTYYCLPDPASTRSTPTTTSQTAVPTIGEPWDQCGGRGFTGPTRCRNSVCVRMDECKQPTALLDDANISRVLPMPAPVEFCVADIQNNDLCTAGQSKQWRRPAGLVHSRSPHPTWTTEPYASARYSDIVTAAVAAGRDPDCSAMGAVCRVDLPRSSKVCRGTDVYLRR
ncbi:carbohydrate-binding module family 1 protein [Sporormia fimetaria CBS 119925]|uniref:cellulase n=1 Tax=Sporormia fimetaria CBS 119925 TaxID=1340428 RepID=A0A6A6UW72_9PLEO|nr:carbohydrate-binding module family 1 protein [Sporormia fimetaria CBS 119925]